MSNARIQKRAANQQARLERRAERQEARQERRAERQEARQERRANRQEARQTRRADRQEARQERRAARRGEEPKIIINTQNETNESSSAKLQKVVADTKAEIDTTPKQISASGTADGGAANGPDSTGAPWAGADEAVAAFENDPKAFFEKLNSMGSEERGAWLMMVQQQIQQTNQLVSAITNFQKAQHDTQKAVLANLRV